MTHIREDQFIDVLMGEPPSAEIDAHLAECAPCQGKLQQLQLGLLRARQVSPKLPLMPSPVISYRKFKRHSLVSRMAWLAAAALLLFSLLGLRVEFGKAGVAFQFSFLGQMRSPSEARIKSLEESLLRAVELNAALTQSQLDARFNAFYQEHDEDLGSFSRVLSKKMNDLELNNALYLATVKEDIKADLREREMRGKLQ